jgi:hypothetical protein
MRKSENLTITAEGRDKGKVFVLTEMSAVQAEKWATRALLAVAKSKADIPDDIGSLGAAGLLALTVRSVSGLTFADAEPLLDEMMTCVKVMPDPGNPNVVRGVIPDDFEEVSTLLTVRKEVFRLHTGFSVPGAP